MRAVVQTGDGVLELNWMWLPTWIGMNSALKARLEKELQAEIVGRELTEDALDEISNMVIEEIATMNPGIDGVQDYLDGLKFVRMFDGKEG